MSRLLINGFEARETVIEAPPSKALTLRYLLASALSRTWVSLSKLNWGGDDAWSMIRGGQANFRNRNQGGDRVRIRRGVSLERLRVVDVGESGFTLRTDRGGLLGYRGSNAVNAQGGLIN
ncbi:hypothetical protein [Vulcanisaeta souniana]|uniref:hypothetical protein n=1 Tax=Vulcanisaeta souniana TaxID=164452 RepID=UPI0006CF4CF0|nr:hypothetical protein [Vulcanisaeta souniana]